MNVLVKYFSITQQTVFSLRCSSPGALLFRYGESFLRGRWTAGYRQSSVHAGNKTPSIHVHPRAFDVHGRPWIHVHPPRGSAVRGSTSMDRWMDGSERLVWIDGFQHTGSANSVAHAAEKIRKVSDFCCVTWKKQKAYNNEEIVISKEYDFIGIHFDHNKHQVSVARKTLDKLPAPYKAGGEYEVTQLEKDISRLLFCTGALRIMSATFYFALKWVNRHVARLNKPDADLNQKVVLPKHVASLLNVWICKSKLFVHLPPSNVIVKPTRYDVLFTDASAYGWGAIFIGGICPFYFYIVFWI